MLFSDAHNLKRCRNTLLSVALSCSAMISLESASSAAASRVSIVELHAFDGSAAIKGELLDISHGAYVIETALGIIRVSLEEAECVGEVCPVLNRFDADFSISSPSLELQSVMLALLSHYADSLNADVSITGSGDIVSHVTIAASESNQRALNVSLNVIDAGQTPAGVRAETAPDLGQTEGGNLSVYVEPIGSSADDDDGFVMAYQGAAVIVHLADRVRALSQGTIAQLFSCDSAGVRGSIGSGGPLNIYAPPASSETHRLFRSSILDPFGIQLCDSAIELPSDADIAAAVAGDANAVGLISLAHEDEAAPLAIRDCGLILEASSFGAKTEEYPFARRISLRMPSLERSSGSAQRFADFALSDIGQKHLEELGLISLNLDLASTDGLGYRLARIESAAASAQRADMIGTLIEQTESAVRVSATFQFQPGGGDVNGGPDLNNRAQRDLTRLVRFLKTNAPLDAELLLFGFADTTGDYDANLALSQRRAQSVADKLAALGVAASVVTGFGEEAPVACNDDASGRAKNRRVEVWLRFLESSERQRTNPRITM